MYMNYDVQSTNDLITRAQMDKLVKYVRKIKRRLTLLSVVSIVYIASKTDVINKIYKKIKAVEHVKGE